MKDERKSGSDKPISDSEEFFDGRPPRPGQQVSRSIGSQPTAAKVIARHTVQAGDTLGGIALKYYKNAGQKFYMAIYEANKGVIGENPNAIRAGMVLDIPEAPTD